MKRQYIIPLLLLSVVFFHKISTMKRAFEAPQALDSPKRTRESQHSNFIDWAKSCDALPYYVDLSPTAKYEKSNMLDDLEFRNTLDAFQEVMRETTRKIELWNPHRPPRLNFFDTTATEEPRSFFVKKHIINPGTTLVFQGDLHGDIHSLIATLRFLNAKNLMNGFSITNDNIHLVFLGDYVDRGAYGAEVLYTIMRLKIANPNNVILIRGNHEDNVLNTRYGFTQELLHKGFSIALIQRIYTMYALLPVALFLGSGTDNHKDYLLCCHGAFELGYDPRPLLLSDQPIAYRWIETISRTDAFINIFQYLTEDQKRSISFDTWREIPKDPFVPINPLQPSPLGFMWHDFQVEPGGLLSFAEKRGAGLEYGEIASTLLLKWYGNEQPYKVRGVFRAHQHDASMTDMMKLILKPDTPESPERGLGKLWHAAERNHIGLWDGIICTFNVAPDSAYGDQLQFTENTIGILTTAPTFNDWNLQLVHIPVIKKESATDRNTSEKSEQSSTLDDNDDISSRDHE